MADMPDAILERLKPKIRKLFPRDAEKRILFLEETIRNGMIDRDGKKWTRYDFTIVEREMDNLLAKRRLG